MENEITVKIEADGLTKINNVHFHLTIWHKFFAKAFGNSICGKQQFWSYFLSRNQIFKGHMIFLSNTLIVVGAANWEKTILIRLMPITTCPRNWIKKGYKAWDSLGHLSECIVQIQISSHRFCRSHEFWERRPILSYQGNKSWQLWQQYERAIPGGLQRFSLGLVQKDSATFWLMGLSLQPLPIILEALPLILASKPTNDLAD